MGRSGDNGTIPDGWQVVRLGDVLKLQYGVSLPERVRKDGTVPVIGSAGVVGFHSKATTSGPGIVVGRKGSIGSITWTASDFVPIDTTYFVVPMNGKIDLRWAFHLLNREDLSKLNRATGVPGLNRQDVYTLRRSLPPLPEQRAIAAVLDGIDESIERTDAVIAATEQLRDSLLHELLTRGVPGWHTEWKEAPGIGTIPVDWEVVRLGDGVTHVGSGVTPRGEKTVYTESGVPFLRSQNVYFDGLSLKDVVYISSEVDDSMRRSRVRPGDVLLNITGASIGRCTIAPMDLGPANVNQHVCIIRTTEGFNPRFVWKWLSAPRSQREIDEIQTGQSRQGLNYQQVRQLTVARPSRPEQDSIVEMLGGLDLTLKAVRQERDGLQSLKTSTADALLTGRARVKTEENNL